MSDSKTWLTPVEYVDREELRRRYPEPEYEPCPRCRGTGFANKIRCIGCNGAGEVLRSTSAKGDK